MVRLQQRGRVIAFRARLVGTSSEEVARAWKPRENQISCNRGESWADENENTVTQPVNYARTRSLLISPEEAPNNGGRNVKKIICFTP